jgi:hypothetical protein
MSRVFGMVKDISAEWRNSTFSCGLFQAERYNKWSTEGQFCAVWREILKCAPGFHFRRETIAKLKTEQIEKGTNR